MCMRLALLCGAAAVGAEALLPAYCYQPNQTVPSDPRIIGGEPTVPHEYPFIVVFTGMSAGSVVDCGGVLISSKWVVTVAHCAAAKVDEVLLGYYDINTPSECTERIAIKSKIIHPLFDVTDFEYQFDIAVVELQTESQYGVIAPTLYGDTISGVGDLEAVGNLLTVAGYGYEQLGGPASDIMNKVDLPVYPIEQCREAYGLSPALLDQWMCTLWPGGGKDACRGDSGTPAFEVVNDQTYIVGLVSFGISCATPQFPGVYTKVSPFIDWICTNTGSDVCPCGSRCGVGTECENGYCVGDCPVSNCCLIGGDCTNLQVRQCVEQMDPYCASQWDSQCRDEAIHPCGLRCPPE